MPALTVHNAEVKTAAVEVKTLTISGKQVTQAMFRQLRDEPLIADDGTFNGLPWGTVNYHPDRACKELDFFDHWHVIWQRGSTLLRALVTVESPLEHLFFFPPSGPEFFSAHVRDVITTGTSPFWGGKIPKIRWSRANRSLTMGGPAMQGMEVGVRVDEITSKVLDAEADLADAELETGDSCWFTDRQGGALPRTRLSTSALRRACHHLLDEATVALTSVPAGELWLKVLAEVESGAECRQRHRDLRATLADLPQLFIAV